MAHHPLPVAIIGAGPVGLSAAAYLVQRGESFVVFEIGDSVAHSVRAWAHVRLFSPWRITLDRAAVELLEASGWQSPDLDQSPMGSEIISSYLQPLANLPSIAPHVRLGQRVTGISRQRTDKMKDAGRDAAPFVIRTVDTLTGTESECLARAVIDASGTWHTPNPLGADGLASLGERTYADRIAYGIPDVLGAEAAHYTGKRVLVVGSGHSAINTLLALDALSATAPQTRILWALRKASVAAAYGGQSDDALPERGALGTRLRQLVEAGKLELHAPFYAHRIQADGDALRVTSTDGDAIIVDRIVVATGFRPDYSMAGELRLGLDSTVESTPLLAPMIDPNLHSCGTVRPHGEAELRHPEPNFYVVGMKSYGRAPTFLLATGYEQVRSVVAALVGDWEAARAVQLELPETGVCCTDNAYGAEVSCCDTGVSAEAVCCTPSVSVRALPLDFIPLISV
ncbi:MAG: NAD(P)-binding domain-containing protein [Armatimonadetes bacterium]|nr:NAD(P)-binding domain-containing protein [Anaerolineae bacterium]